MRVDVLPFLMPASVLTRADGNEFDSVRLSTSSYVLAVVYIARVGNKHPAMAACALNVHRLLLVAVLLAVKVHEDVVFGSSHYAAAGGVTVEELHALEHDFLRALQWRVSVKPEEYELNHKQVCAVANMCVA